MAEVLDADDVIQQQRARMADLEEELKEKLRTAELELSVERAKIAREQTELAEWRMELESLRESIAQTVPAADAKPHPQRRWLSKLGLGGEEENG